MTRHGDFYDEQCQVFQFFRMVHFFVARAHIGERVCGEVSSIAAVLRDRMQVLWKWGLKTEKFCELEVVFLS